MLLMHYIACRRKGQVMQESMIEVSAEQVFKAADATISFLQQNQTERVNKAVNEHMKTVNARRSKFPVKYFSKPLASFEEAKKHFLDSIHWTSSAFYQDEPFSLQWTRCQELRDAARRINGTMYVTISDARRIGLSQ